MGKVLWIATSLLIIQAVHSYILLTANIDDIRNIAQRVAHSPIGGQVKDVVRRAYDAFNYHLYKARTDRRADDTDIVLSYNPEEPEKESRKHRTSHRSFEDTRHESDRTFASLGRSASVYLDKIKNIFQEA